MAHLFHFSPQRFPMNKFTTHKVGINFLLTQRNNLKIRASIPHKIHFVDKIRVNLCMEYFHNCRSLVESDGKRAYSRKRCNNMTFLREIRCDNRKTNVYTLFVCISRKSNLSEMGMLHHVFHNSRTYDPHVSMSVQKPSQQIFLFFTSLVKK